MGNELIVYISKYGSTKATVEKILSAASGGMDVVDLAIDPVPSLEGYGKIILGCGIYIGDLNQPMRRFIQDNHQALRSKEVVFFLHGLISKEEYKEIALKSIEKKIGKTAVFYLGGSLDLSKVNVLQRALLSSMLKASKIDPKNAVTLDMSALDALLARILE